MEITLEEQREILSYITQTYFANTHIERIVLHCIAQKTFSGEFASTKEICRHLQDQSIETSAGAVRGTILRIRHKLLKYREESKDHAFHLTLPEEFSRRGYMLKFEKNPHYRGVFSSKDPASKDPWLAMNWNALREQGYRGLWRGLSLPDGGRWPVRLYVWINTVRDEKKDQEKFMCLLDSPSSTKRRIGIMEGEIKDSVLYMQGKWSVHYPEEGVKDFNLSARLWPFRTNANDPVKISGRFVIHHEPTNEYQEGQIELDYSPQSLQAKDFVWADERRNAQP